MKSGIAVATGFVLLVFGCVTAPQYVTGKYEGAAARVAPKHVIFVGWDGFAGNTVAAAEIPTLRKMMAEGSWTVHSRSILPTDSACNWRSIFTCSSPELHGYVAWNSQEPKFPPAETADNGCYPDIFYMLRQQKPASEIGLIYEWNGIGFVTDTNACNYVKRIGSSAFVDLAVAYIKEKKPTFLAICYDHPDREGHGHGWGSPEYHAKVTKMDTDLGRILEALKEADILEETVVLVSSDHGGTEKGRHGGPTLAEMERPVVLWGKGVKRGHELAFPGTVYDTGATLAALLGIKPPSCWIGRPFDEAF